MKKYLALLLFALITTMSFGQSNYQDVVYLKNGSIIRGVIIEQVPNKSIKIETTDRSVFVYQMDEIEKLTKEVIQGKNGGSFSNSGFQSGYKGIFELGYQIGAGDHSWNRLKLDIINGYQINPYFSLGFGTGLRLYSDSIKGVVPIFADFRVNSMGYKISPYLSLGVGYSFNATNRFKVVGFLLNSTVGFSFKGSDKSAINIGLGYEIQKIKFSNGYNRLDPYLSPENLGAITINVGISFQMTKKASL